VLQTRGETTEVDKSVSEYIVDPLTHLVRNAIDHGIEAPDERQRVGRIASVASEVSAYQQSGNIHIEVSDDGRAWTAIASARRRGRRLVGATDVLGDRELFAFIFRPGFSTADRVSEFRPRVEWISWPAISRRSAARSLSEPSAGRGRRFTSRCP